MERGWRDITPNCPRCGSSNTKFCYYNNYSLTQPRYFCKGCRRYWTKGGSLRNVPVGGGCRKSRRSRTSSLRLASSSHHHHGVTSRDSAVSGHEEHVATSSNQVLGHSSYGSPGQLNNMIESGTSSMNSEVPTIDLAVVYANYLSQKVENNDSTMVLRLHDQALPSEFNNPPLVEFSSIPDATTLAHTSQALLQGQEHINFVNCTPPFSQALCMPQLSNNNDHNQLFLTDFSRPAHHGEDISTQHELGLPPLPGEPSSQDHQSLPWPPNSNIHHGDLQAPRLPDLELDTQFSNLYVGSWSSLDLPGFETSSSSSKP